MVERAACSGEASATLNGSSSGVGEGRGAPSAARFSLFRWFRRAGSGERAKTTALAENGSRASVSSSADSVDTLYSTATVRSFAFRAGTLGRRDAASRGALRQAAEVGPFAKGAAKVNGRECAVDVASTLPASAHSRGRDIATRYSLQPFAAFDSCGDLLPAGSLRRLDGSLRRLDGSLKGLDGSLRRLDASAGGAACAELGRRRVHVRGKRRAPDPPKVKVDRVDRVDRVERVDARDTPRNGNRRKRRAPRPPDRVRSEDRVAVEQTEEGPREEPEADGGMERGETAEEARSISNDTLVLQGGVLLSKKETRSSTLAKEPGATSVEEAIQSFAIGTLNPAMPRPWYKRSVFEHSRDSGSSRRGDVLRGPTTAASAEVREECSSSSTGYSVDASLTRRSFFHRGDRQTESRRQEARRKSGLSILTNISELDKEAAMIVQEEQARTRASMLLKSSRLVDALERRSEVSEELVQDMVTSAMENSSPRRGTRALISKFNAISNITKVTVNANFFARSAREHQHRQHQQQHQHQHQYQHQHQQQQKFERDVVRSAKFEHDDEFREHSRLAAHGIRVEKDISRYFLPQQRTARTKLGERQEAKGDDDARRERSERLADETSSRISFLQSQLAANRASEPVMEGRIRSGREAAERAGERQENGLTRRYFGSGFGSESAESVLSGDRKLAGERKRGLEAAQKEFSDIFDEIDRQLRDREFNFACRRGRLERKVEEIVEVEDKGKGPAQEPGKEPAQEPAQEPGKEQVKEPYRQKDDDGASSKVSKVLDILVEAEKDGKTRAASKTEAGEPRPPMLIRTEDPTTTDLKEMLKEMKHSLPKRPKPKKMEASGAAKGDAPIRVNRVSCFVNPVAKVDRARTQDDYEINKQKVSSSAQTSGNVIRRSNQPSTSAEGPTTSGWKQEDVLYRTSGKSGTSAGLVKNTFQLIRPRDFAEIEAIKTTRRPSKENAYANVIEQSLYANTVVPTPRPSSPKLRPEAAGGSENAIIEDRGEPPKSPVVVRRNLESDEDLTEAEEDTSGKNMNTLAINRLLRKLEAAIASGHHQQAAGLAKELARLKIQCSVIRQRSARLKDQLIRVSMYIEDKLAHQGPIPLQLPARTTVAELKAKVQAEFEIPADVQRWIIGKNLADRDGATLDELQAVDGSPVFLYLVAPELHNENVAQTDKRNAVEEPAKEPDREVQPETLQPINEEQEESQNKQEEAVEPEEAVEEVKMDRYEELISLENCDVIPNSEPIECPVCFVTYGPREGVILRDCLHMFCRPCLANTIKYCEEAEVKCPYRDTEYTCESTLQEREIKALVEPEVYRQHLAKSIAQAENNAGNNAFHCKMPDCPGWCIYDDDVNNFLCPVCGVNNCLTCQAVHTGKNCRQYQLQLRMSKETDQESRRTAAMLEEMVDRGEALACPTCAVVLMKKWGCDWLRCSMCKTEICWVTRGPRWGPGGKGDTSGGCRCGENGVKCHPRCNYCH